MNTEHFEIEVAKLEALRDIKKCLEEIARYQREMSEGIIINQATN